MSTRRQARELALQVTFQKEFSNDLGYEASLEHFRQSTEASDEACQYAMALLQGLDVHYSEIDEIITAASANWSVGRMSLVDRNILRLATFEIRFSNDEIPIKVAINEAVEVAKKYGTSDSAAFINGLLDEIAKK